MDANDLVCFMMFDYLKKSACVLDGASLWNVRHIDGSARTGAVLVYVLPFGHSDSGDLGTREHNLRHRLVVNRLPPFPKAFFTA